MNEPPKRTVNQVGNITYRNADGQLHREDGPASIYTLGYQIWYKNGEYHRDNGKIAGIHPRGKAETAADGTFTVVVQSNPKIAPRL